VPAANGNQRSWVSCWSSIAITQCAVSDVADDRVRSTALSLIATLPDEINAAPHFRDDLSI
jgi:hypothetical protein